MHLFVLKMPACRVAATASRILPALESYAYLPSLPMGYHLSPGSIILFDATVLFHAVPVAI